MATSITTCTNTEAFELKGKPTAPTKCIHGNIMIKEGMQEAYQFLEQSIEWQKKLTNQQKISNSSEVLQLHKPKKKKEKKEKVMLNC